MDSKDLRQVFGRFATGITVITTRTPEGEKYGVTINSFASVSLDPPLILWSLQNDSEMFEAFERCTRWAVNILRSDQEDLSSRYAKRGDHQLLAAHAETGTTGIPVMPASLVSLECELEQRYPGGDHVILLARVLEMTYRGPGNPLVFCAGSYRQLAG